MDKRVVQELKEVWKHFSKFAVKESFSNYHEIANALTQSYASITATDRLRRLVQYGGDIEDTQEEE